MSQPITHKLKTWPEDYEAMAAGIKNFEIRKNDRDFHVGDILEIAEYTPYLGYTGRRTLKTITYIFRGGVFGLDENYCILSI